MIDIDALKKLLIESLNETYVEDRHLYENDLCERCKVFRIGLILSQNIDKIREFSGYSVDSEYNKRGSLEKIISRRNPQFPDLILHQRGNPSENLLVVEFKKSSTHPTDDDLENDRKKLEYLTKDKEYNYKVGAHVCLCRSGYIIKWYIAGNSEPEPYIYSSTQKRELKESDPKVLHNIFLKNYVKK